jgi:hypothetical protein
MLFLKVSGWAAFYIWSILFVDIPGRADNITRLGAGLLRTDNGAAFFVGFAKIAEVGTSDRYDFALLFVVMPNISIYR